MKKFGKTHINIGTEDKPKGICGRRGKYMSYGSVDIIDDLPFEEACQFCLFRRNEVELNEYYKGSISGQLNKKAIKTL